jgi:hypothetical protein
MTTYNFEAFTDEKITNCIRELDQFPGAARNIEIQSPGFADAIRAELQRDAS